MTVVKVHFTTTNRSHGTSVTSQATTETRVIRARTAATKTDGSNGYDEQYRGNNFRQDSNAQSQNEQNRNQQNLASNTNVADNSNTNQSQTFKQSNYQQENFNLSAWGGGGGATNRHQ